MKYALFVLLLSIVTVPSGHADTCKRGQYFSDFTHKCETAVLLLGRGDNVESLTIAELRKRHKGQVREFVLEKNPAYEGNGNVESTRKYVGIRLEDILAKLLSKGESLDNYVLAATCLDGFDPVLDAKMLSQLDTNEAFVAFEQRDIGNATEGITEDRRWEKVKAPWGIVSPAPFYLVWSQAEGTYPQGWPFQIKSLRLIKAQDYQNMLAKLRPAKELMDQKPKTAVEAGYEQVKGKCMTCHQVNGVGGKKAPLDLLEFIRPFTTEEGAREVISAVIAQPPAGMNEVKDMKISDEDVAHISAYLRHLGSIR